MLKPAPPLLLPTPRVVAIRGKPSAFQLLDYEVSALPGVSGIHARKVATLCGFSRHRRSPAPAALAFVYDRWAVQQLG